jgi:hypothetical protein
MTGLYPIVRRVRRPLVVEEAEPPVAFAVEVKVAAPPTVAEGPTPEASPRIKGLKAEWEKQVTTLKSERDALTGRMPPA